MRIKGKGKSILTRQRLPVLGLFEGLLDQVSGAAAAYSIRLLRADYSGGLVRVRAFDGSSDQGEADVLPDGNNEISLNSELTNRDSTAGSSGRDVSTLGELVTNSGGTDYDGFVSEWKDQSPNARHATQTSASEQPQLVDAGNLITDNNKPSIKYNGSNSQLIAPTSVADIIESRNVSVSASTKAEFTDETTVRTIFDVGESERWMIGWSSSFLAANNAYMFGGYDGSYITAVSNVNSINTGAFLHHIAIQNSNGDMEYYIDNALSGTNSPFGIYDGNKTVSIGRNSATVTNSWDGKINEVIIWDKVLSSNEINTLYNNKPN